MARHQTEPACRLTLADGSTFTLRPVTGDDKPLLLAGFEKLSDRSRYHRFLSPTPTLSKGQLAYLSELDHRHHVALGVLDGDVPVAIGRFVQLSADPDAADVALTVVDDYQGRGLGRSLIQSLAVIARHRGIRWLHFDVLAENHPMLALLDRLGAEHVSSGPLVHGVLDAESVSAPIGLEGDLELTVDVAAGLVS